MTPDLHISIASASDSVRIATMSRELIEHGLPWTWRPERVARAIAVPDTNVAVAKEGPAVVAFGIMEYLDEDAHLVLFAVCQAQQRKGVGGTLLRWLEASAQVAGARNIRLETRRDNVAARSFYNELGYHELGINFRRYSGLVDGIQLEKWLRPARCDA